MTLYSTKSGSAIIQERISDHRYQRDKVKLTYTEQLDRLPNGTFVLLDADATPYLVLDNALFPWNFTGYGQPIAPTTVTVQVLTPRSTVRALAHGYVPDIHPTAMRWVATKQRNTS